MKRILIGVAAVMIVTLMSGPVLAGTQNDAVISLHLKTHAKGDPCTVGPISTGTACSNYVVSGNLNTAYDMYLTVAKGVYPPGLAAVSCGIIYDNGVKGGATKGNATGVDVYGWTFCASGLQFPNGPIGGTPDDEWPASGGGNRMTWNAVSNCLQTGPGTDGVQGVAGAFYIFAYSTDFFQVTPNNNLQSGVPELQVGDCSNSITDLPVTATAFARFSTGAVNQGCNPCLGPCTPVAAEPTTWGKMKQRY